MHLAKYLVDTAVIEYTTRMVSVVLPTLLLFLLLFAFYSSHAPYREDSIHPRVTLIGRHHTELCPLELFFVLFEFLGTC
jgi:hypothetical protein